jgi:hypothetical protein
MRVARAASPHNAATRLAWPERRRNSTRIRRRRRKSLKKLCGDGQRLQPRAGTRLDLHPDAALADVLLDCLKLLYDATLRDNKMPACTGPSLTASSSSEVASPLPVRAWISTRSSRCMRVELKWAHLLLDVCRAPWASGRATRPRGSARPGVHVSGVPLPDATESLFLHHVGRARQRAQPAALIKQQERNTAVPLFPAATTLLRSGLWVPRACGGIERACRNTLSLDSRLLRQREAQPTPLSSYMIF